MEGPGPHPPVPPSLCSPQGGGDSVKHLQSNRAGGKSDGLGRLPQLLDTCRAGLSCLSPGDSRHGTQHFEERWTSRYPADIPGAKTGSDLSDKVTLLALILAAAVIAEPNPSLHGSLVPKKFRNDPGVFLSRSPFQNTCCVLLGQISTLLPAK